MLRRHPITSARYDCQIYTRSNISNIKIIIIITLPDTSYRVYIVVSLSSHARNAETTENILSRNYISIFREYSAEYTVSGFEARNNFSLMIDDAVQMVLSLVSNTVSSTEKGCVCVCVCLTENGQKVLRKTFR